ncbi:MAG: alpha/beta fold hydrolase [Oligoflexus sp.]
MVCHLHCWGKFLVLCLLAAACSSEQTTSSSLMADAESRFHLEDPILIDESNFNHQFDTYVLPLWNKAEKGFFSGEDQANLFYAKYPHPNPKGNVLLVPGYSENSLKYRELAYNFYQQSYTVYTYDHRGHGFSDRLTGDREMVYVEKWQNYVHDLQNFMQDIVASDDLPIFIFAHSMGAAIVTEVLQKDASYNVQAVVMNAPLHQLNTDPYPNWMAKAIASLGTLFWQGEQYAPGQGPVNEETWTVEGSGTSSVARFERYKYDSLSENIALSGASNNWVRETLKAGRRMTAKNQARKLATPIRLYQAGQDTYVLPGGQNRFCAEAPSCTLFFNESAKHEIYNEVDTIRNPYLNEVFEYFESFLH